MVREAVAYTTAIRADAIEESIFSATVPTLSSKLLIVPISLTRSSDRL